MSKPKHKESTFKDFLEELKQKKVSNSIKIETKEERKYFLIVCEGERTEPQYFNYFKKLLPRHLLETIEITGEGDNTLNIVKKAIELKTQRESGGIKPKFDEVWGIYDKDDFAAKQYHQAITLAEKNGIKSGHSNQSFELWYVLHFQYLQSNLHRKDYIDILSKELGFKYQKNDPKVVEHLFKKCDINQAISWAKKLDALHIGKTPAKSCPSTQVYKLVEILMKYCQVEESCE